MTDLARPTVFVLLDFYLPGYKSGGPLRTIENTVNHLGDRFNFWILTRDRDATDTAPYPGVLINAWNKVGKAMVYYAAPGTLTGTIIRRLVADVMPDVLYLNSFFSNLTIRTLGLRRIGMLPPVPVVLAPRGEFSPGALRLKAAKKQAYLAVALRAGLYRRLIWQASSEIERDDIRRVVGEHVVVKVAPNIAPPVTVHSVQPDQTPTKQPGMARFVFLSRVAEKKNLDQLLGWLPQVRGQATLDIYGPIREPDYWRHCQGLIAQMPSNVHVDYAGSLPHDQVAATLASHHFFVLPTLGENFGHAILEALAAGCPVVISDQTPWRQLAQRRAGWDLPLGQDEQWRTTLQQCIDMDEATYRGWSAAARAFGREYIASAETVRATATLFEDAVGVRGVVA